MQFKYFDIHTHVNLVAFTDDKADVITRARDGGVALINVGTQFDTSKSAVELARKYDSGVYATVGLHPIHTSKSFHDTQEFGLEGKEFTSRGEQFDSVAYAELARDKNVVAIGECGLDYYRVSEDTKEKQFIAFRSQIELAKEVGKPLMLHVRDAGNGNAYRDTLSILNEYPDVVGNVHFFAGSKEIAGQFLERGFTLSFTGVITFAKDYIPLVDYVPLDMMHAETDAPYVTPVPYRGKRNEPLFVIEVVKKIAEIKMLPHDEVQARLLDNAKRVFGV